MDSIKIAMILYTQGLEYDDRIRKEILSITKRFTNVIFEIFAVTPNNREETGVTQYGVKYHIPYLKSRDRYKSGTHTLVKAFDFYKTIKPKLKSFDGIWCADIETFLFPLFLSSKRNIIWDQHEIPLPFVKNKIMRMLFRYLEKKCRLMYHANQSRIDYLRGEKVITDKVNHIAIRNYPENPKEQLDGKLDKYIEFIKWKRDNDCIYLQGVNAPDRLPYESMSAILRSPGLYGVIVGSIDQDSLERLKAEYGEKKISTRLYFTGKVPQLATKMFMKECIMSLVFYKCNQYNNIYCEPNRMFQSIVMGLPIIVGCNPSMKEVIDKHGCGIVLKGDGSNIEEIVEAILYIRNNYESYKKKVALAKCNFIWNSQDDLLCDSFQEYVLNQIIHK